jgi:Na+/proline symporter
VRGIAWVSVIQDFLLLFAAVFVGFAGTLQRNAVIMPLDSVAMPRVFSSDGALLVVPDLGKGDLAMPTIVRKTFPAWFLGIVGGAVALTAMVPAAIQLLTGATLYAKNLFRPIRKPDTNDQQVARLARIMVLVLTLGGLLAAIYTTPSPVSLLLLGSAGIAHLFPGVVCSGCSRSACVSPGLNKECRNWLNRASGGELGSAIGQTRSFKRDCGQLWAPRRLPALYAPHCCPLADSAFGTRTNLVLQARGTC